MTPYPWWLRALEYAALALSTACGIGIALELWREATTALHWALVFGAGTLGYLAADFVTGVVHWAGDRLGTPSTPVLGPAVIEPFRAHHVRPEEITQHGFVELCGSSFILVAPAWALAWGAPGEAWSTLAAVGVRAFMLALGLFTGLTNQLHCWAHQRERSAAVAWLQRRRLILAPERHALHHTPPFEGHYCVTTGWCNALLARSGFFERLERWLGVSRAQPRTN